MRSRWPNVNTGWVELWLDAGNRSIPRSTYYVRTSRNRPARGARRRYEVGSIRGSVSDVMRCFPRDCGRRMSVFGRSILRIMIA